ncbi:MAG: type III pantothenate kinase [Oscillospiraceae bacterium]|nr:type III pantothenate kinase [Oscillospiraceae bacterium]
MILAIDVGNTNITIGCVHEGSIALVFAISTNIAKTAEEYAMDIKSILDFHKIKPDEIEGAIISCVVPPLSNSIRSSLRMLSNIEALIVGAGVKTGMNILIDDPAQLGGDMVAAAVGALATHTPPIIVVDMGTAIKMCVLDKNGSFIGGAIMPGLSLSMNALSTGTSQLPHVTIEAPGKLISKNTIDCMKSGAVFGTASMIDGMISRFENELDNDAISIITGGHAELVKNHCLREIKYDPHLILRGLEKIYERNRA